MWPRRAWVVIGLGVQALVLAAALAPFHASAATGTVRSVHATALETVLETALDTSRAERAHLEEPARLEGALRPTLQLDGESVSSSASASSTARVRQGPTDAQLQALFAATWSVEGWPPAAVDERSGRASTWSGWWWLTLLVLRDPEAGAQLSEAGGV